MRTRQKLTAVGAFTLASTAIGGGALVTSHAMADESTPATGTMTVVQMKVGDDEAIRCTFDDVDLPTVVLQPAGEGVLSVIIAGAPGVPVGGGEQGTAVVTEGGTLPALPTGATEEVTVRASAEVGGPTLVTSGAAPDGSGPPPIMVSNLDARPGTDEECAALRPGAETP